MDLIMALCAEAGSLLLSDFLDQEHKTWPDEVVLPRSRLSGRQSGACSFLTPPGLVRSGFGAGALPYQEMRSHPACTGLVALCGSIFPCFRLSVSSFVLPNVSRTPGQPRCSICEEGTGAFCCSARRLRAGRPRRTDAHDGGALALSCLGEDVSIQCLADPSTKMQWAPRAGIPTPGNRQQVPWLERGMLLMSPSGGHGFLL